MSRRRCALSPRYRRLHHLQAVASPLISSYPSPLVTMVVSFVTRDEGIVVKDLGSKWESSDQSGKWLKLKPEYIQAGADLDVLIIDANRSAWMPLEAKFSKEIGNSNFPFVFVLITLFVAIPCEGPVLPIRLSTGAVGGAEVGSAGAGTGAAGAGAGAAWSARARVGAAGATGAAGTGTGAAGAAGAETGAAGAAGARAGAGARAAGAVAGARGV
ncbi:hypothetical protein Ahy_A05g024385 [Arachis hypogaea]|uniref:ATP-dependent DNA ligase family profile domain-containing protein n=1 Tax=Arachis hypogaea TaxID=3818 RepID=A0A445D5N8_ARAHY|nr:hypothetical protein Ahy_A05g024385 [Arachis hypogaea]